MYLTEEQAKYQLALIERVTSDFTYHSPDSHQITRMQRLRDKAKELAYSICENCTPSREQEIALGLLEQAVMMANASIAREEKHG